MFIAITIITTTNGIPATHQLIKSTIVYCQTTLIISKHTAELTPSRQGKLEHVSGHVVVEDPDDGQVHMESLQTHPGEGNQQKVVQEKSCGNAQAHGIRVQSQPRVHQEHQVQKEQTETQMNQDLGRNVAADFSVDKVRRTGLMNNIESLSK